jgi:hypothetical protein
MTFSQDCLYRISLFERSCSGVLLGRLSCNNIMCMCMRHRVLNVKVMRHGGTTAQVTGPRRTHVLLKRCPTGCATCATSGPRGPGASHAARAAMIGRPKRRCHASDPEAVLAGHRARQRTRPNASMQLDRLLWPRLRNARPTATHSPRSCGCPGRRAPR